MCNSSKPTSSIRSVLKRASCIVGVGVALAAFSQGAAASCSYVVNNQWGSGFTASINITNSTSSTINGWNVSWQYNNNRVTNSWNANVSGSNPYTATSYGWNGTIQPGQTVSFGFQGNTNGGSAETPSVTGAACSGGSSSSRGRLDGKPNRAQCCRTQRRRLRQATSTSTTGARSRRSHR